MNGVLMPTERSADTEIFERVSNTQNQSRGRLRVVTELLLDSMLLQSLVLGSGLIQGKVPSALMG
jgi:hypothetical protein